MIEIRNLTKIYKKQTVLNDVNLRLEMGKIYGLVGVNGSGKTTLMRCIAGFANPTPHARRARAATYVCRA